MHILKDGRFGVSKCEGAYRKMTVVDSTVEIRRKMAEEKLAFQMSLATMDESSGLFHFIMA